MNNEYEGRLYFACKFIIMKDVKLYVTILGPVLFSTFHLYTDCVNKLN